MSIQSIDGSKGNALQWLESLKNTNRAGTNGVSNPGGSVSRPNHTVDFSQLVQSFGNLLREYRDDFGGSKHAVPTDGSSVSDSTGSAAEYFLGSRNVTGSGSGSPAADETLLAQAPVSPSTLGHSAVAAANTVTSLAASPVTPAQNTAQAAVGAGSTAASGGQTPSEPVPGISEDNPQQMCTLTEAQTVLSAFPNATLEVWTDNGPVPASSLSNVSADQPLPYLIAYGSSPTGGQNLFYAGVIVSQGQQAMQQTGYGEMAAGDYYVWNNTPNANGVTGVTDAGSNFAQFAQYYAKQLMAGNPVNPDVYTPFV